MNDYLTTRELAELLRIKERKVYDLASSGKIPCSRATGKLLFPRTSIEHWINEHASGGDSTPAKERPAVVLGSHDPLLEWAIRESRCGLASYFDSSLDGLQRFAAAEGIATGLHIYDVESSSWNRATIESEFQDQPVVLVTWSRRQRGIISAAEKPFERLGELENRRVVPRQPEAGSQVLLNALLQKEKVNTASVNWLAAARSEMDAVLAVQEGKADATFGLATLASQYGLAFSPVVEEQFDLLVDRRAWFESGWQKLYRFCQTSTFQQRVEELAGYRVETLFDVVLNVG